MDLNYITDYFNQFIDLEHTEMTMADVRLETIQKICEYLNHPELAIPCIHVAGSKGKGSITTMAGAILKAAGFKKVGLYRSPSVLHFTERISEVDGAFPEEIYRRAFDILKPAVEDMRLRGLITKVTYYELVTALAFLVFKEAGCDYVVYEVGAGGRLDATNVIQPEVAVISTIELEHVEFLGGTLEKIAAEKAGIIKPGVPVVIGFQQTNSVKEVFREKARAVKAGEMYFLPDKVPTSYFLDDTNHLRMRVENLAVDLKPSDLSTDSLSNSATENTSVDLRFVGDFQATNALAAVTAVKLTLPNLQSSVVKSALEKAFLPGRFEITTPAELVGFSKIPYLILDGAHTPRSVAGAVDTLEIYRHLLTRANTHDSCLTDFTLDKKPILLFACAKHKLVEDMTTMLKSHFSNVILTKPGDFKTADLPRAEQAFKSAGIPTRLIEDYEAAIAETFRLAEETGRGILALGSLYLVGEVKKFLEKTEHLPAEWR